MMSTFGIVTSYTPSLQTVAHDIAYALRAKGYTATTFDRQVPPHEAKNLFKIGIVFIPFDPLYSLAWFLLQRDYNKVGIPSVTYVTVEGLPKKHLVRKWVKRDCTFIACSNFVKDMLSKIDVDVINIIPHGVNIDKVNQVKNNALAKKEEIKQMLGVKVLFGTVASNHPRKNLASLAQAIKIATQELNDVGFYIVTTPNGRSHFIGAKNTYVSTDFGKMLRAQILTIIGSFDFYIHPSYCEGFGLPVLEAHAFGVPCILPRYAPLTEHAHPEANFWVPIKRWGYENLGDGILYLCHYYTPEEMASKIKEAYDVYTSNPDKYRQLSITVEEHAKKFHVVETYSKFLEEV